jgi:hypothetical protein
MTTLAAPLVLMKKIRVVSERSVAKPVHFDDEFW